ncbi:MAG: GNAT family N-acetyltransferase [bacterium]|nr:GNAT family N-acetyltransferase [bacterium]
MSVSLRHACPDDATTIHALVTALAVYEREPDAVRVTPEILRAQLGAPQPPFECLLAEDDGVVCGFALFFSTYSTWVGKPGLWLEDLFVLPAHRRRGVGRLLLQRLAQLAEERGGGRLEWSVLDWNAPALAFYRELGAQAMDAWTIHRVHGPALRALAAG